MKMRRKIRSFLTVFLALLVTGNALLCDVHISRAEECKEQAEEPEGEPKELFGELEDEPKEVFEGPGDEPGELFEEPGDEPGELFGELEDEPEEVFEESGKALEGPGETSEESEDEPEETLELQEEEPGEVPEVLEDDSGDALAEPEETWMPLMVSKEVSYPIYVPSSEVTILEQPDYNVLYIGGVKKDVMESYVGEMVSSQHRAMINIRCSKCAQLIYTLLPLVYSDVAVSYSDELLLGEHEYFASRWTQDDTAGGSGCLQLNTEVLRPGTTDVEILYNIRFTTFYNAGRKCPLCSGAMPQSNDNSQWYRYRNAYQIKVYADYTIKYDANAGGDYVDHLPDSVTEKVCADSAALLLASETPTRFGYNFVGWAKEKDARLSDYLPGEEILLNWTEGKTVEKTLYAVWERVVPGVTPERPADEEPDLTFIKKACGTDTITPITSVETGETYSYVVTVRNNMEYAIENLSVSEVLDTDLIQILNNPPDYENEIWKIDHLKPQETAVLILHVKALAECPEYENTIHLMAEGTDGREKEILPGPDDQPTAVVEIREGHNPPPEEEPAPPREEPDPPEEEPDPPKEEPDLPEEEPDPPQEEPDTPEESDNPDSQEDPETEPGSRTDSSPDPTPSVEASAEPVSQVSALVPSALQRPVRVEQTEGEEPFRESTELPIEQSIKRSEPAAEMPIKTKDPQLPLAARGHHLCCILHFVILLLAWIVELFYMRSMKKHQSRIFELRRELEDVKL